METIIEIDSFFRYPIDSRKWEVRKTTRQIRYRLTDLKKGAFFGHEEILQGFKRRCRVRCNANCSLIYLNRGQHGHWAPDRWAPDQVEKLKKGMRILDLDYIVGKIDRFCDEKSRKNTAVFDASKVNSFDVLGMRSQGMHTNESKH